MNQINYVHVMTPEEVEESNQRMEEWWTNLSRGMKQLMYNFIPSIIRQEERDNKEAVRADMARIMDEKMGRTPKHGEVPGMRPEAIS